MWRFGWWRPSRKPQQEAARSVARVEDPHHIRRGAEVAPAWELFLALGRKTPLRALRPERLFVAARQSWQKALLTGVLATWFM
ncbi:MAG TPA: hypothetical protein VNJ11_00920 [Bryobacteraceae bacterium]|nr:hypothetical protein [Bryobacteraceae bacterium]